MNHPFPLGARIVTPSGKMGEVIALSGGGEFAEITLDDGEPLRLAVRLLKSGVPRTQVNDSATEEKRPEVNAIIKLLHAKGPMQMEDVIASVNVADLVRGELRRLRQAGKVFVRGGGKRRRLWFVPRGAVK